MAAAESYASREENVRHMISMKDLLTEELEKIAQEEQGKSFSIRINSQKGELSAPHILSATFAPVKSEVLLHALEEKGIYVSAGSACSSHSKKESSTLKAMGASAEETDGALRISMSEFTTREELETLIVELKAVIDKYGRFIRK